MRIEKYRKILLITIVFSFLVMLTSCSKTEKATKKFETIEDLENCTFAISDSNTSYEIGIAKEIPGVVFDRYTNYFDTFIAVANGNADASFCFRYTFIGLKETYPNLEYINSSIQIPICANFSSDANELKESFNSFIEESKQNGLIEKLATKWCYEYDKLTDKDVIDFSDLEDINGSFKFGISSTNVPYEYLRNGKFSGFETALLYEFCKACGYKPIITESQFDAVVAGVSAGKYDMAMGGYGYTKERNETSNFSDSYFLDNVVYAINVEGESQGLFSDIKSSFERTFIKEGRWKLFIDGMAVTLLITLFSVIIGSLLGFGLFLLSQRNNWLAKLSYSINDTLEALPVLVVLMIFFYVIFGKSSISGVTVSIIVFGLCFAFTFFALVSNSVRNVPKEQTEAGLALSYSDNQTLFKIVLPQAMETFIPSIRSAIIATLKGTAIVGYVAVQDLTKAGDLIRSQTFEAFLPIITVAILYFALAKFLIFILSRLLVTPSEARKMKKEGK